MMIKSSTSKENRSSAVGAGSIFASPDIAEVQW